MYPNIFAFRKAFDDIFHFAPVGYSPFKISTNELNTVKVKAEAFKNGVKWTEGGGKLFEESIHTSQAHQPDQENNT